MFVKILGFTMRGYLKSKWNVFDGTLVIASMIDILLSKTGAVDGNQLSVLKVFRLVSGFFVSFSYTNAYVCMSIIGACPICSLSEQTFIIEVTSLIMGSKSHPNNGQNLHIILNQKYNESSTEIIARML